MSPPILLLILLAFISSACIKDESKITPDSAATGDTGGGTTTGGSSPTVAVTDPLASQSWHLNNTGQSSFSTGFGILGQDISWQDAYDLGYTGAGIRVAVSDTGTEQTHEDLAANMLSTGHRNYGISNPSLWRSGFAHNVGNESHGTAVTGLIAAVKDNGKGSHGIAPKASIANFRYVSTGVVDTDASGIAKAIDQADGDFDIFNYSYGYGQCYFNDEDETSLEAFEVGATTLRGGKGAIYVQSAGNSFAASLSSCLGVAIAGVFTGNTNHSSDLAVPYKVIAAAMDARGLSTSYSTPGSGIWISAPGGEDGDTAPAMVTTDVSGCTKGMSVMTSSNLFNSGKNASNRNCQYTNQMNGTSSAAPVTSGVIAMMLQANPLLDWRDVKHILALTADKVDYSLTDELFHPFGQDLGSHIYDMKWVENQASTPFSYSNWYGFGRINALQAVLMASTYTFPLGAYAETINPNNQNWYYDSGAIIENIPDANPVGAVSSINVRHNFIVESVQIKFTSDHANPEEVGVVLISPSGTESRLLHINNGVYSAEFPEDMLLMSNAFYGEESSGNWQIRLVDGMLGNTGDLLNWKIKINGRKVTGDGSSPNPVSSISLPTPFPSTTVTPTVSFTGSTSPDVARYELSIGTSPGATNISQWVSIGTLTSAQILGLSLTNNANYYLNIRAVDTRENTSSVRSAMWRAQF